MQYIYSASKKVYVIPLRCFKNEAESKKFIQFLESKKELYKRV